MVHIIRAWFNRYFSDPEAVLLFFILLFGFGLVMFMGNILMPVLISIVIAYLLEWIVAQIQKLHVPRLMAVLLIYIGFLGLLLIACLVLLPLLWNQVINLFNDLPNMLLQSQKLLFKLVEKFPDFFSQEQVNTLTSELLTEARNTAKIVLSISWSSIIGIITGIVYLILVPLLIFFFLKDKNKILAWAAHFLPHKRGVLKQVFTEVNKQIGNYIRGKAVEMLIVSVATYIVFAFFNMQYAILLALLVGISMLIPYIGGIVVTIAVMIVAYLQWGWSSQFGYCMSFYLVVQVLDGNVLVPLLFSEAVNLHPVAIVVATLFFGGIWGFWGVFFAIPLATLVKAVLNAWPKPTVNQAHKMLK
jgi:putative permease